MTAVAPAGRTVELDTGGAGVPLEEDAPLTLRCAPAEAAERLALLAELGFDDAVLFAMDHRDEALTALRSLALPPRAVPARTVVPPDVVEDPR